jgi:hypothetical protein
MATEPMVDYITSLDGYGAAERWPDGVQRPTLLVGASTYRLFVGTAASGEEGIKELTVRSMKEDGDVAPRTIGSPSLCRSLLEAGRVDRATGADRIYDGWPDVALEVAETRTFDGGLQLFEFAPTVLDGPPAVPEPSAADLVS